MLFEELILKYFPKLAAEFVQNNAASGNYSYKVELTPQLSIDGTWSSLSSVNRRAAADVISMDSPLPLKSRPVITRASGEIPKIGMALTMNERQLKNLQTLLLQANALTGAARAGVLAQLQRGVFDDLNRCILGIDERLEFMYLQSQSLGVTVADPATNNNGLNIRIDQGYVGTNKIDSATAWGQNGATPYKDVKGIVDTAAAKGIRFSKIKMDQTSFNYLVADPELKAAVAGFVGIYIADGVATPDLATVNRVFAVIFGGAQVVIVAKVSEFEQTDGTITTQNAWAAGAVVFLPSDRVGALVYTQSAEFFNRDLGVVYADPTPYIVAKKWQDRNPIKVWTAAEAFAVPVLQGVESFYHLDTTKTLA